MKLYNTLGRTIQDFEPINPPAVTMYLCGPTVYDNAHIGHMRKYVGDDVLRRTLVFLGFKPTVVMNITDVGHLTSDADTGEDKMEKGARKHGLNVWDVAQKFTQQFFDSIEAMNIRRPDIVCKATDHIPEQIELIQRLADKGLTYTTRDGVYFDTGKLPQYGKLSGMKLDELREGARVEKNPEKRNPTDFALWKFSPRGEQRQMEWKSPWGVGFPGWHIECSAMSMKYLGEQFDIHTGGIDHIPVHHTNEIAQAEGATGTVPFVKYWVHHNFLRVNGEKMSKSLNNFYTVADLVDKGFDPLALRYLFLTGHYRSEMNFTWETLTGAHKALMRLVEQLAVARDETERVELSAEKAQQIEEYRRKFSQAIGDDLKTPEAVAVLWEVMKSNIPGRDKYDLAIEMDQVLGLKLEEQVVQVGQVVQVDQEILELVKKRDEARKNKDWAASDVIRERIVSGGYTVVDTSAGTVVKKK